MEDSLSRESDSNSEIPEDCHFCGAALSVTDHEVFLDKVSQWETLSRERPGDAGPEPFAMCGECRADCDANAANLEVDRQCYDGRSRSIGNLIAIVLGSLFLYTVGGCVLGI